MIVFIANSFGFAIAGWFWDRHGWKNKMLGATMLLLSFLNAMLAGMTHMAEVGV